MQYILDQLGVGTVVEHKKFGEGVIAEMEKGKIWIAFEEGTKSFQATGGKWDAEAPLNDKKFR